jgi:hypothetical protein
MLANPVRLRDLATSVADGLIVDDDLDIARMADLAASLSELLDGGIDAYILPAYARTLDDAAYMVAYRPGVQALAERLAAGRPLPPRPPADERAAAEVAVWTHGRPGEAARIERVLYFASYRPSIAGSGPADGATAVTTVYAVDDHLALAEAVAGLLGAPVRALPPDLEAPGGAEVVG